MARIRLITDTFTCTGSELRLRKAAEVFIAEECPNQKDVAGRLVRQLSARDPLEYFFRVFGQKKGGDSTNSIWR